MFNHDWQEESFSTFGKTLLWNDLKGSKSINSFGILSCRFQAILDKYRSCKAGRIRLRHRRRRVVRFSRFYFEKRRGGVTYRALSLSSNWRWESPRKKSQKPRKNYSKSRAFSNNCCNFFPKINSQRKTGLNLENFWMTDFCIFSQNRPKIGRPKFGIWL